MTKAWGHSCRDSGCFVRGCDAPCIVSVKEQVVRDVGDTGGKPTFLTPGTDEETGYLMASELTGPFLIIAERENLYDTYLNLLKGVALARLVIHELMHDLAFPHRQ